MQHNIKKRVNSEGKTKGVVLVGLSQVTNKTNIVTRKPSGKMKEPTRVRVAIGTRKVSIRYVDDLSVIESGESRILPIQQRINNKKKRVILSRLLKTTGLAVLADIGDAILGKY